jgi:pimeloyl-ACP methyl ester carboxylesterase
VAALFAFERGDGRPAVFLHGFGLSHLAWREVFAELGDRRHLIAYDLPGHAGSLGVRHGSAAIAADAVAADLERRGALRVDLVGHSMGGAVAALIALRDPQRVASLTLLSPGGFGREINHQLLRRYAAAVEEAEIAALLREFFAPNHPPPPDLAASLAKARAEPGASAALGAIVETFFEGTAQRLLPLAGLARLQIPTRVFWGTEDRVLPAHQAEPLRDRFDVTLFKGVGHMLPQEIPDAIARVVLEKAG